MKAVNLIPSDAPGGRSDAVRAGLASYVLLGVLVVLLLGVTAYVLTGNDIAERRDQLVSLETRATEVQRQAERLNPYVEFATLAQARVQTVRQLGAARFDWHRAFTDLAKVLPDNVWLTSLLGSVAPGVTVEGGASGTTSGLRSSLPSPAIELTGCTTSHEGVVRLISRLRLLPDVQRVSLADSVKLDDSGGGATAGDDDCRHGHSSFPQFNLVVFFDALPAVPAPPTGTVATSDPAAAAPSTTAPATGGGVQ